MDTRDPLVAQLAQLVGELTGTDAAKLTASSSSLNTSGWDSMANVGLIGLIEEELGVIIGTADAIRLSSLGDFAAFVRERRPQAASMPDR